jgi:uncharacterized protein
MIKAKWQDWFGKTTEELAILDGQGRIEAQSIVRGTAPDFTCQYRVKLSENWIFREVEIQTTDNKKLFLTHDGSGNWRDALNKPLEHLQGALEIDFVLTPFTNTLPIKRLNLERGESAEITTAWIDFPSLDCIASKRCRATSRRISRSMKTAS